MATAKGDRGVRIAAHTLHRDTCGMGAAWPCEDEAKHRATIGRILYALYDEGYRLLPPASEKRAEHGVMPDGFGDPPVARHACTDRMACREFSPHLHTHERDVTAWPDGSHYRTAWRRTDPQVLLAVLAEGL